MAFASHRGTRGAWQPRGRVLRWANAALARRRGRSAFGFDVLILTTVGRRTGVERSNPVSWFPDPGGGWLIVASANGAADNPAWYYNLAAAPGSARIEVRGRRFAVTATELHGPARDAAWRRIVAAAPRFTRYQRRTDRELPVIRLVPTDAA